MADTVVHAAPTTTILAVPVGKEVNDVDAVHEAAVMTRREEIIKERRSRLTENKTYKLGIDTKALSGQVDEKVMQEAEERAQDAAYDELRLNVDKHLMFVDQQRDAFLRARQEDINDFRLTMQRKEDRREWDLNNPHALQNDAPARRSDDDPNLSVSGLQKFAGEDLQIAQRTKQQQAQLRAWADAQAREKAEKDANEKLTDALWANHMLEADLLRTSYAEKEAEILRQRQKEFAEYNLAQAELKKQLRVETDAQAEMDNAVEIQNQLNSAWLTEDPAITRSFVQPHRWGAAHPARARRAPRRQPVHQASRSCVGARASSLLCSPAVPRRRARSQATPRPLQGHVARGHPGDQRGARAPGAGAQEARAGGEGPQRQHRRHAVPVEPAGTAARARGARARARPGLAAPPAALVPPGNAAARAHTARPARPLVARRWRCAGLRCASSCWRSTRRRPRRPRRTTRTFTTRSTPTR